MRIIKNNKKIKIETRKNRRKLIFKNEEDEEEDEEEEDDDEEEDKKGKKEDKKEEKEKEQEKDDEKQKKENEKKEEEEKEEKEEEKKEKEKEQNQEEDNNDEDDYDDADDDEEEGEKRLSNINNEILLMLEKDLKIAFFNSQTINAGEKFVFYVEINHSYSLLEFCMNIQDLDINMSIINLTEDRVIFNKEKIDKLLQCPVKILMLFTNPCILQFEFDNSYSCCYSFDYSFVYSFPYYLFLY